MKQYTVMRILEDDNAVSVSEPVDWYEAQSLISGWRELYPHNVYMIKVEQDSEPRV